MENGKIISVFAVLMAVVLIAGCTDNVGTEQETTTTLSGETGDETTTTTVSEDSDDETTTTEWQPYRYNEGEYYEYSIDSGRQSGTLFWDVKSVDGEDVAVKTGVELDGGKEFNTTLSGNKDNLQSQSSMSPVGPFLSMGLYNWWVPYYSQGDLSVGSEWSVSSSEGTFSFEITGKETYGGEESYVSELSKDGDVLYKGAVAEDLALPTYVAVFDSETGEKDFEMELESYNLES